MNTERLGAAHALLLVENDSVPGDRRVWAEALALQGAGYRVSVISPMGRDHDVEPYAEIEGIAIRRFRSREAAGGPLGYVIEYGNALLQLRRLARRVHRDASVDVVHIANPPDLLALAVRSLRRQGAKIVFDHHDLAPELLELRFGRGAGLLRRLTRRVERTAFAAADVVIAPNETYRKVALGRGRKRPEDVFVVRMALDENRFAPGGPDPALRRGKAHLLAYVGIMGLQDGVDVAVRALAALHAKRQDWHAVLAGDGAAAASVRELSLELGLEQQIDFPGYVGDAEMARILRTADVCLAPEPRNPFNEASTLMKVVEYMAFARPVVAFDLAETRTSAGGAAAYAAADTPEALAVEIDALLDDPMRRQAMGAEGRRRVTEELSWGRSESALLDAYRRVLSGDKT